MLGLEKNLLIAGQQAKRAADFVVDECGVGRDRATFLAAYTQNYAEIEIRVGEETAAQFDYLVGVARDVVYPDGLDNLYRNLGCQFA